LLLLWRLLELWWRHCFCCLEDGTGAHWCWSVSIRRLLLHWRGLTELRLLRRLLCLIIGLWRIGRCCLRERWRAVVIELLPLWQRQLRLRLRLISGLGHIGHRRRRCLCGQWRAVVIELFLLRHELRLRLRLISGLWRIGNLLHNCGRRRRRRRHVRLLGVGGLNRRRRLISRLIGRLIGWLRRRVVSV
jgi:hypothetical protein